MAIFAMLPESSGWGGSDERKLATSNGSEKADDSITGGSFALARKLSTDCFGVDESLSLTASGMLRDMVDDDRL